MVHNMFHPPAISPTKARIRQARSRFFARNLRDLGGNCQVLKPGESPGPVVAVFWGWRNNGKSHKKWEKHLEII